MDKQNSIKYRAKPNPVPKTLSLPIYWQNKSKQAKKHYEKTRLADPGGCIPDSYPKKLPVVTHEKKGLRGG